MSFLTTAEIFRTWFHNLHLWCDTDTHKMTAQVRWPSWARRWGMGWKRSLSPPLWATTVQHRNLLTILTEYTETCDTTELALPQGIYYITSCERMQQVLRRVRRVLRRSRGIQPVLVKWNLVFCLQKLLLIVFSVSSRVCVCSNHPLNWGDDEEHSRLLKLNSVSVWDSCGSEVVQLCAAGVALSRLDPAACGPFVLHIVYNIVLHFLFIQLTLYANTPDFLQWKDSKQKLEHEHLFSFFT